MVSYLAATGIPMLAAALAQKLHAPNLILIYEAGEYLQRLQCCLFLSRIPEQHIKLFAAPIMPEAMECFRKDW